MLPGPLHAGAKCNAATAERADAALDHLDNWDSLELMHRRYANCEDGDISEGISEAIARLLVDHWHSLHNFNALVQRHPTLLDFVTAHLNSTLNTGDLEQVVQFSKGACPSRYRQLCRRLGKAAKQALSE